MKENLPTNPEPAGCRDSNGFSAIMTLAPDTRLRLVDDDKEVLASSVVRKWNEPPSGASTKKQKYILVFLLFCLAVRVWFVLRHVRF